MQPQEDALLLIDEIAALTRASRHSIEYWRKTSTGLGPLTFRCGGRVVARRSDIVRWIADQEAAERGRAARSVSREGAFAC